MNSLSGISKHAPSRRLSD